MIKIHFFENAICVNGHAQAEAFGKDIYCAGVSAIVLGALNWFKVKDVEYHFESGSYYLKIINKNRQNLDKLELIKIQLKSLLNDKYKKYIKIKIFKKEYNNEE